MTLAAGELLQVRYRIGARLGQGGMGAVYRGYDTRLDVPVAVKELTVQPGLTPPALARLREQFGQEAKVLARLRHPHLVRVSDFFVEHDNAYLVMDLVAGEDLAARIAREGALPEAQVLAWARDLLDALAYCHDQGVIHRDVKPQNVIIDAAGHAVLVDFGLVKLWDASDPVTQTAVRGMGTLEYAPPEQYSAAAGHTDPRSDLYSLGSTLYHALTGQAPPTATDRMADPDRFLPVRRLNPRVTPRTEAAILRAMALPRAERFADARAMAEALRAPAPVADAVTLPETMREPGAPGGLVEPVASRSTPKPEVTVARSGKATPAVASPAAVSQAASAPAPSAAVPARAAASKGRGRRALAFGIVGMIALVVVIWALPKLVPPVPATPAPKAPVEAPLDKEAPVEPLPDPVFTIATAGDLAPMSFIDGRGQLVGYEIDLMHMIAERAGVRIEFVQVPRDRLFEVVLARDVDAGIASVTINEERERRLAFSTPYFNAGPVIVVAEGSPIRSPDDLRGHPVGVLEGTGSERIVVEIGEIDLRLYGAAELAFEQLAAGELDAVVCDFLTTARVLYERRGAEPRLEVVTDPLTPEFFGIVLHPDNPELLERINAGLDAVRGDEAAMRELGQRWLP